MYYFIDFSHRAGIWRAGWWRAQVVVLKYGYYTLYALEDPLGAFKYRVFSWWLEHTLTDLSGLSFATISVTLTTIFALLSAFFLTRYLERLGYEYPFLGGILFLVWFPLVTWEYMGTPDTFATALLFLDFWRNDGRVSLLCGILLGGVREFAVGFLFIFEVWRNERMRAVISAIGGFGVYFTIRYILPFEPPLLFPWFFRAESVGVFNQIYFITIGLIPAVFLYGLSYYTTDRKGISRSWWVSLIGTLVIILLAEPNEVRLFLPFWIFFAPAIMNLIGKWNLRLGRNIPESAYQS